jgi:hypothetical protein
MAADTINPIEGLQRVKGCEQTHHPYILFNKSAEQLRRLGARGGKANARNQRARRALVPTPFQPVPPRPAPRQTATAAITVLDAQFPWLRGAEKRVSRNHGAAPAAPDRKWQTSSKLVAKR